MAADSLFKFAPRGTTALHKHPDGSHWVLNFDRVLGRWRCIQCGRFA